ncbi:MAG: PIG-L family deacetylase [Cyclobacteriaceae bacterium]
MKKILTLLLMGWIMPVTFAQPGQPNAAAIKLKLKKLNYLGTVLYVAAHPDDENTRAIAYFANERLATTGYLSMTRGDGGQNLIGPEIRDLLGLIRTQELLAARRIDGGEQFFTRANDFGYSKNAAETMRIWDKQEILSDVVRIIRQFQPDVIITRFPPDERAGHGHHTTSAILAQEAFDIANDPKSFPEQLKSVGLWQVKRLFTNTGRWWNQSINENTPGITAVDVGAYNYLLGKSYSEIAAESRTQHKSQGFGSAGRRGEAFEYLELEKGDRPGSDIMDGVNTTWARVPGGSAIEPLVSQAIHSYDEEQPYRSIPQLLLIRSEILKLKPGIWRARKLKEVEELIRDCAGLHLQVNANTYWIAPGEGLVCDFEVVNRSPVDMTLQTIDSEPLGLDTALNTQLKNNLPVTFKSSKQVVANATYSDPYWLREDHSLGRFSVPDANMIGMPENDPAIQFDFSIRIGEQTIQYTVPLRYQWTDPVKGELTRPLEIVPAVAVKMEESVLIFNEGSSKSVNVTVSSNSNSSQKGMVKLEVPAGWKVEPAERSFGVGKRGEEMTVSFMLSPPAKEATAELKVVAMVGGKNYDQAIQTISYDHFPIQTLLPKARAKLVRINLKKEGNVIGYVKGAGDDVPAALRNMGYQVVELNNEDVTTDNLKKLDAVVLGIRALNTNERIRYLMPDLLNYVKEGGTMVVQYNNSFGLEIDRDKFSPYSISISRDRVSEEDSKVTILAPDHPALNYPNKITATDFDGWVQERGLYFPDKWDPKFTPLLAASDTGEPAKEGGLLVTEYGNGYYVYTGLSFFRELPEGVPGAYKLFANLVSMGKKKPQNQKVKSAN